MFRVSQEFSFSITQDGVVYNFTGQLVFANKDLNDMGSLHTSEEVNSFNELLHSSVTVPEYWTLETLAHLMFLYARPVFKNLESVNLMLTDTPSRVAEYKEVISSDLIGEVQELESVN